MVSPTSMTAIPTSKWERPKPEFVKVNFNAAFKQGSNDGAYGYILQSDLGEFIAAGAGKLRHVNNALQDKAEVWAMWEYIESCSNLTPWP